MIRWIALLLALLAGTGEVRAQAFFGTNPPANGASSTIATGSTASRTLADRAADVVNVKDYGAVCDDIADDTTAINAAFAAVRARNTGPGFQWSKVVFPTSKACKITGTLNWTAIIGYAVTIEGGGATIDCQVTAGICIDALQSRWLRVRDLTLVGSASTVPTIGFQTGRTNTTALNSSDGHAFENVFIDGTFSQASFYNVGSETTTFNHVFFWNRSASATAYTLIQDGFNHFNSQSAFVTQSAPVDSGMSFNENLFLNCDFRNLGGGPAIWMGNTTRHKFVNSYVAVVAATYGVMLFGENGANNAQPDFDVHFETTSLTDIFLVSGTWTAPIFNGFSYKDHNSQASDAIFKADTGITSVVVRDADIRIAFYSGAATLFSNPSIWTVTGYYASPLATQFVPPGTFQGRLTIGQSSTDATYGAGAYSLQYPDSTVTGGNARGANATDLQTARNSAAMVASAAQSTISGGQFNTANGTGGSVAGGQGNTAGQYSIAGGFNNVASGNYAVAYGNANSATGQYGSITGGTFASDRGRFGAQCYASSGFATIGDGQGCRFQLVGTGATTAAIRTTGDRGVASAFNCVNLPNNSSIAITLTVSAFDHTTVTKSALWPAWTGLVTRGANAAATAIQMNTTPTPLTNGTLTGSAIAATADTTNGCLNISFTPPTSNTDTWNVVARVETVEVQ